MKCALEWCAGTFDPATSHPRRKFCSVACKEEERASRTVRCPGCGGQKNVRCKSVVCWRCHLNRSDGKPTPYAQPWAYDYVKALNVALDPGSSEKARERARRKLQRLRPASRGGQQALSEFGTLIEAALRHRIDGI